MRRNGEAVQRIRKAVIEAKIALSSQPTAKLDVDLPGGKKYQREISLEVFEQMIQPIIDRTVGPCKQALKDAGLKPEQIDEVVLVGGSTRIPKVRRLVQDLFGRVPHTDLNPDEVVALGAAVQANILGGGSEITKEMLLLDVTPLSLGIEVAGGVTDKIILRNSTIPASATQYYTTQVDGQTNVAIHVLQGERELARDCRSLARFDLKGVPPMPAGMPRIEVKFLIDANGILRVSAREQRSGKEAEIDVQPSYGLTDEQVENMLLESFDYAEEDFRQRQVIEARREAETILAALAKGKKNPAWQELAGDERSNVETLEKTLVAVKDGDDYHAIRAAIDALNQATMRLAELMMDTAVSTALKGKTMDDTDLEEGPQAGHPVAKSGISNEPGVLTCLKKKRTELERPQWMLSENTVEVTFLPEGKTVTFEHGKLPYKDHGKEESLLDVALNFGIHLDHACGGNCACTTCHIWVKEGADLLSEMEDDEADKLDVPPTFN